MPRYFFHGLFKKKTEATTRSNKLKHEGARTRILTRKTKSGARRYIVQTISTIMDR